MGHIQNLLIGQQGQKDASSNTKSEAPLAKPLWICLISEFIGTFLLIFIGCGVGLKFSEEDEDKPLVQVALCWGFLIATLGQTLHYSCDINPSVTLAKLVTGKTTPLKFALYVVIQCAGCLAGAYVLKLLTPEGIIGDYGATKLAPQVTAGRAVVIEAICTFFLVFTCFSADDEERPGSKEEITGSKPLSIGLCVCGMILCAAPYTAASFNPARTLGPSIVSGDYNNHWVFWVGPLAGGLIGGLFYHHVYRLRRVSQEVVPPPSPV